MEYFNMKHSLTRNVIEHYFGFLKGRWGILKSPSFYPIKIQCRIITICCHLYNLIRREMPINPLEYAVLSFGESPNVKGDNLIPWKHVINGLSGGMI